MRRWTNNRRRVGWPGATQAAGRLLALSICALLGPQSAPGGLAGCNTCNATPTWTAQTEAGRRARQATSKPCSISRLELPRAPDAFPLWPRWTRERGWPPFSKLFPNVGPACPPITNDQALAIASVHLFRFHLVFLFALSAQGHKGIPLMRVEQSVPAPRTPPSAHHKIGCDKTITKMARPTS